MVERARGLSGVLRERQRSLAQALDAAADADVVSTLEAEGARLAEELAAAEAEAADAGARAGRARRRRGRGGGRARGPPEPPGATGPSSARAEEAVTVAQGQLASLEHALERDRRTLDQLTARLAADRATGRRCSRARTTSWASAWPRPSRPATSSRPSVAETEAAHGRATRRLEAAEESLRQAEQEHARSVARADALERALDEARGAAGAELLAGVDGVVGTLLDLVEVDAGWEEAFEAAAGASVAAVVVSGSRAGPGRAVPAPPGRGHRCGAGPHRRRRRGPTSLRAGGDAAGGDRVDPRPRAAPGRGRRLPGLDAVLDTLLAGSCCAPGGWSEAIDLALARPDLVVVTRDGDRFSPTGWRVRAGGGRGDRRGGRGGPGPGRGGRGGRGRGGRGADGWPGPRSRPPGRRPPRRCGPTTATRWPTRRPGPPASGWPSDRVAAGAPSSRRSAGAWPSSTTGSAGTRPGWPSCATSCRRWSRPGCGPPSGRPPAREERQAHRRADRRGGAAPQRVGGPLGRPGRAAAGADRAARRRSSGG